MYVVYMKVHNIWNMNMNINMEMKMYMNVYMYTYIHKYMTLGCSDFNNLTIPTLGLEK